MDYRLNVCRAYLENGEIKHRYGSFFTDDVVLLTHVYEKIKQFMFASKGFHWEIDLEEINLEDYSISVTHTEGGEY